MQTGWMCVGGAGVVVTTATCHCRIYKVTWPLQFGEAARILLGNFGDKEGEELFI